MTHRTRRSHRRSMRSAKDRSSKEGQTIHERYCEAIDRLYTACDGRGGMNFLSEAAQALNARAAEIERAKERQ